MTLGRILSAAINSMIHGHHAPQLVRDAQSEVDNMGFAEGYAEPGYDDPPKGVLFADWNRLPRGLDHILERAGYAVEWSDEWSTCESCNRAVRTSPNSYSWRRSFVIYHDCEIICESCAKENIDEYEEHLLNNANRADTFDVDWTERGFVRMNKDHYENGFYPGQNDNPREIVKHVPPHHDFLFTIPTRGQFDISFDCWIRPQEEE